MPDPRATHRYRSGPLMRSSSCGAAAARARARDRPARRRSADCLLRRKSCSRPRQRRIWRSTQHSSFSVNEQTTLLTYHSRSRSPGSFRLSCSQSGRRPSPPQPCTRHAAGPPPPPSDTAPAQDSEKQAPADEKKKQPGDTWIVPIKLAQDIGTIHFLAGFDKEGM